MTGFGYKCTTGEYINILCAEREPTDELLRCTVRGWDGEPLRRRSPIPKNQSKMKVSEPLLDSFTIAAIVTAGLFLSIVIAFLLL